jgi:WD40 repeat protein
VHDGPILDLAWSAKRQCTISCSDDKKMAVIDWNKEMNGGENGRVYLDGHKKAVNRLHVNESTGLIWSVSRDLSLRGWDVSANNNNTHDSSRSNCVASIEDAHELNVSAVASTAAGDKVFTGSRDYHVKGWDVETGQSFCDFHQPRNIVTAMKFGLDSSSSSSSNGDSLLYQASEDLCVRVWDVRQPSTSGKAPAMRIGGFVYFALCIDMSSDGVHMATGCKGFNGVGCEVKLWDLRDTSKPVREFQEHQQDVTACTFLDEASLVSCSKDGSLRMWSLQNSSSVASHSSGNNCKYTSLSRVDSKSTSTPAATTNPNPACFVAGTFEGHLELMSFVNDEHSAELRGVHTIQGPPAETYE